MEAPQEEEPQEEEGDPAQPAPTAQKTRKNGMKGVKRGGPNKIQHAKGAGKKGNGGGKGGISKGRAGGEEGTAKAGVVTHQRKQGNKCTSKVKFPTF